jgi:mono/diheme cytochrome c family protein
MQPPRQTRRSEHPDPHEQFNPVPRVILGLTVGLVAWAVVYIFVARPNSPATLGDQRRVQSFAAPASVAGQAAPDGRQLFVAKCQACHQANGQGLPGVFPPLAGSSWLKGAPDIPIQILLHGLNGAIEVAGATYNGSMPAFGEQLSDAELAAVLSFARAEWGNASPAVTASMVDAARKASSGRNAPWQGIAELQKTMAGGGER